MQTNIRRLLTLFTIFLASGACQSATAAALGTAFSYQGRLNEQGQPANGVYDFRFVLRDAPLNGTQLRGTETKSGIPVTDGVFSVAIDFGSSVFDGQARMAQS